MSQVTVDRGGRPCSITVGEAYGHGWITQRTSISDRIPSCVFGVIQGHQAALVTGGLPERMEPLLLAASIRGLGQRSSSVHAICPRQPCPMSLKPLSPLL